MIEVIAGGYPNVAITFIDCTVIPYAIPTNLARTDLRSTDDPLGGTARAFQRSARMGGVGWRETGNERWWRCLVGMCAYN